MSHKEMRKIIVIRRNRRFKKNHKKKANQDNLYKIALEIKRKIKMNKNV